MNHHHLSIVVIVVLWIMTARNCDLNIASRVVDYRRLSAVSFSLHAQRLYRRVRTDDSPYDTEDRAALDEHMRECICEDVTGSGFLQSLHLTSIDTETIFRSQDEPEYASVFNELFNRVPRFRGSYVYTNFFRRRHFWISYDSYLVEEYVFVCPVQHSLIFDVDPLYVSKEYNVSPFGDNLYMPGRFVIGNFLPAIPNPFGAGFVMLAEEPAYAIATEKNFNVELYYLRTRKYTEPVKHSELDPLCKLISNDLDDPDNQHHRFCVAISASSYFVRKIAYVLRSIEQPCSVEDVSFRTAEGIAEADGKLFRERMTRCHFIQVQRPKSPGVFLISRAYHSSQVFVYNYDSTDGKIYVENLSTNISILDELNSFDFVEY